jgi:hypothetical protein
MPPTVLPIASPSESPSVPPSRPRRAFTMWVTILALLIGTLFVTALALGLAMWLADPSYEETNPVVDLGFFALGGVVVGGGLVAQLRGPERHIAGLGQALLGLLALAVAGLLGDRVEPLLGGLILLGAAAIAAALHPANSELLRRSAGRSVPLAALALVAALPAVSYAARMLVMARDAGPSCFLGQCARGDRFAEMAALTVALVLIALLASARTSGWRISAWSAGVAAATLGLASVLLPDVPGSVGPGWGTLTVIWGLLVVGAAEWQVRRTDNGRTSPWMEELP